VGFVVAERVLYLPSMGFCMLVGFGAWQLVQKTHQISKFLQRCMHFSLALLLVTYSLKTVTRNLDWESGMTIYTSGVKLNPASGVMQSNLGIEYAMRNQYDMSEKLYRASMEAAPDYARAFFNFGKLMKIQDQHDSAEWGFRRAIALGESDRGNGKQLGEAYYHLVDTVSANPRRLGEALEICESGIEFADSFGQLYITYSNLLVLVNRTEDALPVTKMAARSNPRSPAALYNLGLVHMKLNQLPEAAVVFRRALSLQEHSVQVLYNLASILQVTANGRQETLQEALELWMKLLSTEPYHTEALVNLASLYYELNDIPKTRNTLLQILQQSPNHTDSHYRLGVLDYMQGNYKQARETFSKISLMQPGYRRTQAYLEKTERELLHQRTL
jgi:tetratricopeptide (TPR) repeat protein